MHDEDPVIDRSERECSTTPAETALADVLAKARNASERSDDELRATELLITSADRIERLHASGVYERLDERGFEAISRNRALDTDAMRLVSAWMHPSCSRPALFLTSIPGQGKTVAAAWALANMFVPPNHEYGGIYVTAPELCELYGKAAAGNAQGDQAKRVYRTCIGAPLLVLDELGRELDPARAMLVLHDVIDKRQRRSRMTLILSNLAPNDLAEKYDVGILDRLGHKGQEHGIALMYVLKPGPSLRESKGTAA